jgi:hypothetical protein
VRLRILLPLVLAALVGVFAWALWSVRGRGTFRLEDTIARLEREGLAPTLDDVLAAAPPTDSAVQERLWRWAETVNLAGGPSWTADEEWYLRGESAPPQAVSDWMEAHRADALALEILDREWRENVGRGWDAKQDHYIGWHDQAITIRLPTN